LKVLHDAANANDLIENRADLNRHTTACDVSQIKLLRVPSSEFTSFVPTPWRDRSPSMLRWLSRIESTNLVAAPCMVMRSERDSADLINFVKADRREGGEEGDHVVHVS
jgi:hypothetical protein